MDFNPALMWLIALVLFVVVELLTVGLTTIWFAGGALAALAAELLSAPFWVQVILFFAVSIALLVFTRPLAAKYINQKRVKTNVESLIGQRAVVLKDIDNLKGQGQVQVGGMEWTARAVRDEMKILADEIVYIQAVDGVKLMVSPAGEREES